MSIYNLILTIQQNAEFRGCVYARRQQVDEWAGRGWGWREWIYCQLTEPWIQADEQRKPQEALSLTVGYFSLSLPRLLPRSHPLSFPRSPALSLFLSLPSLFFSHSLLSSRIALVHHAYTYVHTVLYLLGVGFETLSTRGQSRMIAQRL